MAPDSISEDDVYHVVGDADEIIEQSDGRTVFSRVMDDGRQIFVVVEDDQIVITAWWNKRGSRRRL
jgi:hypothetical protein